MSGENDTCLNATRLILSVVGTTLLLSTTALCSISVHRELGQPYADGIGIVPGKLAMPGVVVVKFKPGTTANIQELFNVPEVQGRVLKEANPTSMKSVLELTQVRPNKASEVLDGVYLVIYSGTVTPAFMAQSIIRNHDVEYAEPHYIYRVSGVEFTPNDSDLAYQYALSKVQAFKAWDITQGNPSVPVGIVDTGVDWMHPDLYGNIWHNPDWKTDTKYPADSIGWDFGGHDGTGTPNNNPEEDFPAHGTFIAGEVAAVSNNGIGIAGMSQCQMMPVKVSEYGWNDESGQPYIVWGYEGIIYAADHGARVINCSWGGVGYSRYEQDVINYANQEGALVVAAAGNDHSNEFEVPAYYDNVLSVAATNYHDIAANFTNHSYNVSVSAPGEGICSTWGTDSYLGIPGVSFGLSGTSFASAYAAGIAALVVSQHPEYRPQQVLEQVRVSADSIDFINPSFVHQLGFGRVNAYRALTVTSPGVMIDSINLVDSTGNDNNGPFVPGETAWVLGNITDWLAPTRNLQLTLTSDDPYVTIIHRTISVGELQTGRTCSLQKDGLSFKVNGNAPYEHEATFLIRIQDGRYSDYKSFTVLLNPRFSDVAFNNLATTISAKGNIGYNDYPTNAQGTGLIYRPDNVQMLFEGAFMAGVSSSKVVDEARDSTGTEECDDFRGSGLVRVTTSSDGTEQETVSTFSDSNATINRLGIQVTLHTYAYNSDSTGDFIILEYRIHNLNPSPLDNFYAGLFLNWMISPTAADVASYDGEYQLGYAYDSTRSVKAYGGCALIYGGSVNYTAINNYDMDIGVYDDFTKAHKWKVLSGAADIFRAGPSDVSMVISGGPVTIPGGEDTVLTFALTAGDNLQGLENAVRVAKEMYNGQNGIVNPPAIPTLAQLYQNYPNPFPDPANPNTIISFALSQPAHVTIELCNVIGQKVATLTDESYFAGEHRLSLPSGGLASGVYFVRMKATSMSQVYIESKKIIVLK